MMITMFDLGVLLSVSGGIFLLISYAAVPPKSIGDKPEEKQNSQIKEPSEMEILSNDLCFSGGILQIMGVIAMVFSVLKEVLC